MMTPQEIAAWMVEQLADRPHLYQNRVATFVRQQNPDLVYRNKNGNWALAKPILDAFRRATPSDDIIWSRSSQMWRHRKPYDKPGRMQS